MIKESPTMQRLINSRNNPHRKIAINCIEQSNAASRFQVGSRLPLVTECKVDYWITIAHIVTKKGARGNKSLNKCRFLREKDVERKAYYSKHAIKRRAVERFKEFIKTREVWEFYL